MSSPEQFLGLATLARRAYAGEDLSPLAAEMLDRVERDPEDADALMDLSMVLQLLSRPRTARVIQERALELRRTYHLPAPKGRAEIRLLAIMSPGSLMANTPLDFLLEDSAVSLDMIFVSEELPLPETIPEHDIVFVAVADSDANLPVLRSLQPRVEALEQPVLNMPEAIQRTTREGACAALSGAECMVMPRQFRLPRSKLVTLPELGPIGFPLIVRPCDSHAGHGLARLEGDEDLRAYLADRREGEFYAAPFIDYRSVDGQFRKYRIVLIDGRGYASHLAISANWMVHYLNAGMAESDTKRREEERFMVDFDNDFGRRHEKAFAQIHRRIGLDYLVMDCAETRDGRLLVFEVDAGAVVHAMDPVDIFPYKRVQMRKVFRAFQNMLERRCRAAG